MLQPLTQWYCDVCSEVVSTPDEGYVIWKTDKETGLYYNFKIIHKTKCDIKDHTGSMSIDYFLGVKGINYILSRLSIGTIKLNLGQQSSVCIKDLDEFVDFIRRVQLPYYEEARRYFNNHRVLDYHSDGNEISPYTEDALKNIIIMGEAR